MVAVNDFSGLVSSPWAFAKAAAMAPMVSLLRCIGQLRVHEVKTDGARFGALGAQTVPGGFLGVLRHQLLQLGLDALVLLIGRAGAAVGGGEFRPGVRRTHIDDPDRLQPRPWGLDPEQPWCLAVLDAAPELLFRGDQEMLVQRVGMSDLDPLATAGNDRKHRGS